MVSYERISREVILVPVNGAQCPQNAQFIKDELNRIYAPAIVSWSVKLAAPLHVDNLNTNGFGSSEMNAFSRYTPNMRKLTRAFKKTGQKEKHTLVLFFIADNSVDFTGFMPLSSDFGFIFNFGSESEDAWPCASTPSGNSTCDILSPLRQNTLWQRKLLGT